MRIDKWIWAVRMAKTRSKATDHCKLGRVILNGKLAKPAKMIAIDDIVELSAPRSYKKYKVLGFIAKQASAERVAPFFEDLTPQIAEVAVEKKMSGEIRKVEKKEYEKRKYRKDQGRLTKRDRRKYEGFLSDLD